MYSSHCHPDDMYVASSPNPSSHPLSLILDTDMLEEVRRGRERERERERERDGLGTRLVTHTYMYHCLPHGFILKVLRFK